VRSDAKGADVSPEDLRHNVGPSRMNTHPVTDPRRHRGLEDVVFGRLSVLASNQVKQGDVLKDEGKSGDMFLLVTRRKTPVSLQRRCLCIIFRPLISCPRSYTMPVHLDAAEEKKI